MATKPENRRIAGQLGRSHRGVAWHGPSVMETLAGVHAAKASAHAGPEVHSIWELVKHITAWQRVGVEVLRGATYVSLAEDGDWPAVTGESEADWQKDLAELTAVNESLIEAVKEFPEDRLEEIVPGKEFSFYYMLHGIIQHNLYHAGQMAMLKRLSN